MRTLLLIAAILPVFVWALSFFVLVIVGVTVADIVADSLIGAGDDFRPGAARSRHALW